MRRTALPWLGVLALLLASCGPAAEEATPAPSPTRPPPTPTATPRPASSPAPGVTPPPATPTPRPTATPAAVPVAGPKYGGVVRDYIPWDVLVWDLQKEPGSSFSLSKSQPAVFSRLLQYEAAKADSCDNPLVLNVAESYSFVDSTTLDVKLRAGIRFHDKPPVNGRTATAGDVAFSFNRAKQVAISGAITPSLQMLDRVEAIGPLTARFHFNTPFPLAPQILLTADMVTLLLAPEAGGPGREKDYSNPDKNWIGTGPFMFKEWRPGVKVSFERNPNYFKAGMPYLDGLELLVVPDAATQAAALVSGKLDMLLRVAPATVQSLKKTRPEFNFNGCPYYAGFGTIWMRTDKPPYSDVRVRRALSMAIARQPIIDSLFMGEGDPVILLTSNWGRYSLAPGDLPPSIRRYIEYHPDEAKRLLTEAGYPAGFRATFEVTRIFGSPFSETIEAMIAMWEAIGIKIEPKWFERGQYSMRPMQGNYDDLAWTRSSFTPFKMNELHSQAGPAANKSHINDRELDQLIDRYVVSIADEERIKLALQIQERVADQAYLIQQPTSYEYAALRPYIRDFGRMSHTTRRASVYERIWLDR